MARFIIKELKVYRDDQFTDFIRDYNLQVELWNLTHVRVEDFDESGNDPNEIIHRLVELAELDLPQNEGYYLESNTGEDMQDNAIYWNIYKIEHVKPEAEVIKDKEILIEVDGGLISEINGIPEGVRVRVIFLEE